MAMATNDLWPVDIIDQTIKPPTKILKEQAALLGPKTQNLVTAEVETVTRPANRFRHIFYLVSPALDNYRFGLFQIEQGLRLYPVEFILDDDTSEELNLDEELTANSEEEFVS